MDLPQPNAGQFPNVEIFWAGDPITRHLSISLRIGTFFGVSNAFANTVAHDAIDCEQLCECDIHADTGDIMASFHVDPSHWPDFAHAMIKKVFQHVARFPKELGMRTKMPAESHIVGDLLVKAQPRRMN